MAIPKISLNKIVKKKPKVCTPGMKITEAAALMQKENCGCLPVVESTGRLFPIGMITDRDIVCRTIAKGLNPMNMLVKDCMTKGCHTIDSTATLNDANRIMDSKKIGRIVLIDKNGKAAGVLSKADLEEYAYTSEEPSSREVVSKPLGRAKAKAPPLARVH